MLSELPEKEKPKDLQVIVYLAYPLSAPTIQILEII